MLFFIKTLIIIGNIQIRIICKKFHYLQRFMMKGDYKYLIYSTTSLGSKNNHSRIIALKNFTPSGIYIYIFLFIYIT